VIALAAVLFGCAWLWWAGIEVPARAPHAGALLLAAAAACLIGLLRSGARLPWGVALARAAIRTAVVALLLCALAAGLQPAVEWAAPHLSFHAGPVGAISGIARAAGIEAQAADGKVVVQDFAEVPAHAASWQQLGLPAALATWVALVLIASARTRGWRRFTALSGALFVAWLPLRFLLVARLAQDLGWLGLQWHPASTALSMLPPAWLSCRLLPPMSLGRAGGRTGPKAVSSWLLAAAGAACVVVGLAGHLPGPAGAGRVLMDDAHSDWEWTGIPFDRTHYGRQSTYSYVSLVDYLAHHFARVATNMQGDLTDDLLAGYDVLILKTPTRPYLASERDAVVRFVEKGGGLLLISDHTNLFGMTTYINPMGEPFGVEFLTDDTFQLGSGQPSTWQPPVLATHPAVAHMPPMGFQTSCTIRPSVRLAPVIVGGALASEPADYSHVNFFGDISADPEERWGMFLQAAAAGHGRGRVLSFTDSTVFSNFSVFFRGTPELALGMIAFLNQRSSDRSLLMALTAAAGLLMLIGSAVVALPRPARGGRIQARTAVPFVSSIIASGLLAGGLASSALNARASVPPGPHAPMTTVAFDRLHSAYRLPSLLESSVPDASSCFDAFFVATQRLHLFPRIAESLEDATSTARVVAVLNPVSWPSDPGREQLYRWVRAGGSLLVMDAGRGAHAAANRFLEPSGMRITAAFPGQSDTHSRDGLAIYGGTPVDLKGLASLGPSAAPEDSIAPVPLVSVATSGSGQVVALLGSELFSMQGMGPVFNNPSAVQLSAYEAVYALFEKVLIPEGWSRQCRLVHRLGETAGSQPGDTITGGAAPPRSPR